MKQKLTFTVGECARLLGVSPGLLYAQVRNGGMKSIRIGRKVIITRAAIEEMLGHPLQIDENI